jgi:hypothetical protein
MKGKRLFWTIIFLPFSFLFFLHSSMAGEDFLICSPNLVRIGAFFHGARIDFHGTGPAGSRPVIEVVGENKREILMKKGRLGLLWLNVGEVHFDGIPNLYLLLWPSGDSSSRPSKKMSFGDMREWGYNLLKERAQIKGSEVDEAEKSRLFKEFVRLKESEGLYGLFPNGIRLEAAKNAVTFEGTFWFPPKVTPGGYEVRLHLIKGDKVVHRVSTKLKVVKVGIPAILSSLAFRQEGIYGTTAVIVAITMGFLVGLIFRGKGRGH